MAWILFMKEEQLITCTHAKKQPVQLLHKQENGAVSLGGEEHNGTRCQGDMLISYMGKCHESLENQRLFLPETEKIVLTFKQKLW